VLSAMEQRDPVPPRQRLFGQVAAQEDGAAENE
jgi:hypothetical protein